MEAKAWVLKVSMVSVIMAFATVFYLQPQAQLDLAEDLALVLVVELAGFLLAAWIAGLRTRGMFLATLFDSVGLAAVISLAFAPRNSPGFDWLVVGIFVIQLAGTASSVLIARHFSR